MKNSLLVCSAFSILAVMQPAFAAHRDAVVSPYVYVRANPHGFFVGTLFGGANRTPGEGVYVTDGANREGEYAWGNMGGLFQGCAWVADQGQLVIDANANVAAACPASAEGVSANATGAASRGYLLANYASTINDWVGGQVRGPGGEATPVSMPWPAGTPIPVFGNYRNGQFLDYYTNIAVGSYDIAWRWVSKDGQAVAVAIGPRGDNDNTVWLFVPRYALPAQLPYQQ